METTDMARKIIKMQRMMFNNSCDAMNVMLGSSENMMNAMLRQSPWTDDSRKPLNGSMSIFKESTETYKKYVDDCFQQLEDAMEKK